MRICNKFCFLSLIIAIAGGIVAQIEAYPYNFEENYTSAGIVPLFKTYIVRDGVIQEQKACLLYVRKNVNGIELIAEASAKCSARDVDSAETAAGAFFYQQRKYASVSELAEALRQSATKIYIGNHITYFLEFDAQNLKDLEFIRCWGYDGTFIPHNKDVVIVHLKKLKKTLSKWRELCGARKSARNVQVRDASGRFRTILDTFLIGLTDNYSKLKHLLCDKH